MEQAEDTIKGKKIECEKNKVKPFWIVNYTQQYKYFENTVGKGEIARERAISPSPKVFSSRLENFLPISSNLKLSSANSLSSEESKICRLGKR